MRETLEKFDYSSNSDTRLYWAVFTSENSPIKTTPAFSKSNIHGYTEIRELCVHTSPPRLLGYICPEPPDKTPSRYQGMFPEPLLSHR